MKKLVALLLALMLALGCVSAFAADDNSEFVTLNWYTKGTKPTDYEMVMKKVNEYLKEKINANVNINFIGWGDEWDTFVSTSVASNEGDVDIMFTADWDNMNTHISNGYLIPLNGDPDYGNLLDEYGAVIKDSIAPGFLTGNLRNGVLYGIACNKEIAADYGFLFDTALVEKYNLADSLKEVEKIALSEGVVAGLKALTPIMETVYQGEKDNDALIAIFGCDQTGLEGFLAEFIYLAGDTYSFAAQTYDNSDPKVINPYSTDLMRDIVKITQEWYQAGYIAKDADQHADFGAEFQTGCYFAVTQSMKPGKGAEFTVNGKASTEVRFTHPVIRTKDVGGSMLAIVEGTAHPERAMQFIALLESDSYLLNTIIFGLEGTHFNFVNDAKDRIEQTDVGKNSYNRKGDAWMFGNQLMNYTTTEEAEDKWEQFAAFNNSGVEVQSLGFNYDPTALSATLTNVNEVKKQYNLLTCGIMEGDVEENLAAMSKAMEEAGLNDVLADVQAQYDAWAAGK
jgi:putative aldouronate transport system substrate-binding protein